MAQTWVFLPTLPVGLFYHVGFDMAIPYNVCGRMQNNYSRCGPSAVRGAAGITNYHWATVQGGDGIVVPQDPIDYRIAYSESHNGNMVRIDEIALHPRDTAMILAAYNESKTAGPKPIADANALFARAATLSGKLARFELKLAVPEQIK